MRKFLRWTCGAYVALTLAVVLFGGGCGGDATTPWHPGPGLLVRMEDEKRQFLSFASWIEIDNSGECRCEVPWNMSNGLAGQFRTELPAPFMRRLTVAVKRAAEAGLEPYCPADPAVPRSRFLLAGPDGPITVDIPSIPEEVPKPLRPLCNLEIPPGDRGLLAEARHLAVEHPWRAVAPSAVPERASYRLGEEIASVLRLRNVGTESIAVPTPSVERLVEHHGGVRLEGERGDQVWRQFRFGPERTGKPAPELTPKAIADLQNLVVLAPGEHYDLPLPDLRPRRPDSHALEAYVVIQRCYAGRAIEEALGAPLVEGGLSADAAVQVVE